MFQGAIFDGWGGLARIAVIAPAAYVALVVMLRVSGKRTLAKLNAFDLVITIAIGSTLASIITSRTLPLVDGLLALGLLIILQLALTSTAVRWRGFNATIKAEPSLLARDGVLLSGAMHRERVTDDEIEAAVRRAGAGSLDRVRAVYLETDGSLAVILRQD